MGKVKEYRRACRRCETEWYIPRSIADEKAPGRLEMTSAKLKRSGSNAALVSFARGRRAAKVTSLEEKRARVAENTRCPSCGSTDFSQQKA